MGPGWYRVSYTMNAAQTVEVLQEDLDANDGDIVKAAAAALDETGFDADEYEFGPVTANEFLGPSDDDEFGTDDGTDDDPGIDDDIDDVNFIDGYVNPITPDDVV